MSEADVAVNTQETETQLQEIQPVVVGKGKKKGSTDLLISIAQEVESLTKTKALHLAVDLATNIEVNYFKLGGVLKLISENSWFEGHDDFDQYVSKVFGFESRKARYLMGIYTELVEKQIPWEKVAHLGWTKLKDLAPFLTLENVDEWVEKVQNLSFKEMRTLLKGDTSDTEGTSKTTSDSHKKNFVLKSDQLEVVNSALAKAKGELGTEYDSVALENICAGYVGGVVGGASVATTVTPENLTEVMKSMGWEASITLWAEVFPEIDITVAEKANNT